jgi:hypothetical protein
VDAGASARVVGDQPTALSSGGSSLARSRLRAKTPEAALDQQVAPLAALFRPNTDLLLNCLQNLSDADARLAA